MSCCLCSCQSLRLLMIEEVRLAWGFHTFALSQYPSSVVFLRWTLLAIICHRTYFHTSKDHMTWIITKVNRIPTHCGVAYERVCSLARGHVIRVCSRNAQEFSLPQALPSKLLFQAVGFVLNWGPYWCISYSPMFYCVYNVKVLF